MCLGGGKLRWNYVIHRAFYVMTYGDSKCFFFCGCRTEYDIVVGFNCSDSGFSAIFIDHLGIETSGLCNSWAFSDKR